MIHEHEFGDLPDDAAGSSPIPFGSRRSTHSSGEGEDPAPPFPPDGGTRGLARRETRNGRTRRWPSRRSPLSSPYGRRLAGAFTPRTKTTAATTVDGGARRTWSCARSSGNRGHRVGMKQGGGSGVGRRRWRRSPPPSHSLALGAGRPSLSDAGAEMSEREE
jgi:hypothetical protein